MWVKAQDFFGHVNSDKKITPVLSVAVISLVTLRIARFSTFVAQGMKRQAESSSPNRAHPLEPSFLFPSILFHLSGTQAKNVLGGFGPPSGRMRRKCC